MKNKKRSILHQFEQAYVKHYNNLVRFAYKVIGNYDDAQDLCQELFVDFHAEVENIKDPQKWLYGAVRNKIYNFFRAKKIKSVDIEKIAETELPASDDKLLEVKMILQEVIDNNNNYKDELEKTIFDLIAFKGYTYEKAGDAVGYSKSKVRYKYNQVINRLNDCLKKTGLTNIEALLCMMIMAEILKMY